MAGKLCPRRKVLAMIPVQAAHFLERCEPATGLPTRTILSLPLADIAAPEVIARLPDGKRHSVFFLNAPCANLRQTDRCNRDALARASYVLPDSIGIELAARMAGSAPTRNLNGTDFTPELLREARDRGLSVFLFGARLDTARKAARRLTCDIPGLRIAGTRNGFDAARDTEEAITHINASGADIVLLAMGAPKQEHWIDAHRHRLDGDPIRMDSRPIPKSR